MSGFFGIFSPTEKSIDLEAFEQMQKATELEGFDGMETHVEDNIAMGHLMLRVSPESKYDKQPLRSSCGNYLLVGHFRLDYRDELGDKLGLIQSELEKTPDSVLVMMAYQKWKEKCFDHLEGDWAFAIYDKKQSSLTLFRDHQGYCALFYILFDDALYFTSDVTALLAIDKIEHSINELQLFTLLMKNGSVRNGQTVINSIHLLSSSNYLLVDSKGIVSTKEVENGKPVYTKHWKNEEDVVSQLHITFSLAVKSRARSNEPAGVFLSSGFDSSAVAYYLAKENANFNKRVFSFTSYPFFLGELPADMLWRTNEEPLVRKFVESISNIDSAFLDFPDSNTLSISPLKLLQDPNGPISSINSFWIDGILEIASKKNIRRLFCGQAGNYTISWDGSHEPIYLFSQFKFLRLMRDLRRLAKRQHKSFLTIVYSNLIFDFFRLFKYKFRRGLSYSNAKKFFSNFEYKLSRSQWVGQQNDLIDKPGFYFDFHPENIRLNYLKHSADTSSLKWHILAHSHGIEITDPTSDSRVSDFFKSLNGRYYIRNGTSRYIYRKWMGGNLPAEILEKKFRIMQAADIGFRMHRDFDFFLESDYSVTSLPLELEVLRNKLSHLTQSLKDSDDFTLKRKFASNYLRNASVYSIINYFNFQFKKNIFAYQSNHNATKK